MAVVKNLMVRAGADFSPITKQAKKAAQSIQGMQQTFSTAFSGIKRALGAAGVALSFSALVSAAKDAKEAFETQATAEAKLSQAMRNTMGASAAEVQSIKDLASAQQRLGVIGDEVQLSAAQELATYLNYPASLRKLLPVMNDVVAQQYGLSASAEQAASVATMFGKVMDGQTGALSRYGYSFTEAQAAILKYGTEEQRAATLAEVVEDSVGGMNEALAKTPSGQLKQVSNALGDIKEAFGQAVTTALNSLLPVIWDIVNALASLASYAQMAANAIAAVFGGGSKANANAYGGAVGKAADNASDLEQQLNNAGKTAEKTKRTLAGFDELTLLQSATSGGGGGGGSPEPEQPTIGPGTWDISTETPEVLTRLQDALQKIKDLVDSLDFGPLKESFGRLLDAAGHLADVIRDGLGWVFDNILTPLAHWTIEDAAPAVVDLLASAFEFLATALGELKGPAQWVWDNWLAPVAAWEGDNIIDALHELTQGFKDLTALISGTLTFSEFIDKQLLPFKTAFDDDSLAGQLFGTALDLLLSPIAGVADAIDTLIDAGKLLHDNWENIKKTAKDVWTTSLPDSINSFIQKCREMFGNISDWIEDAIDDIKDCFDFEWSLPGLKLPHIVVGSYIEVPVLGTIPDPRTLSVEWYAKGGIVDGATLIGAGERGAEAILPLENNTGWMDALADRLAERIETSPGAGGSWDFYLDGRLITKYVTVQQRQTAKASG